MSDAPNLSRGEPPRSLWRPIGLALLSTLFLAISTCAGGFAAGKGPNGLGSFLLIAGLCFWGLFLLTLLSAAIYFIVWIIQKAGSR